MISSILNSTVDKSDPFVAVVVLSVAVVSWRLLLGQPPEKTKIRRRMSFNSRILIEGSFPESAKVAQPIVNVAMFFPTCPTLKETKKVAEVLLEVDRFRSIMVRDASGKHEFAEKEGDVDLDQHVLPCVASSERDMYGRVNNIIKDEFDGSDGIPLFRFVCIENKGKGPSCVLFRAHHVIGDGLALVGAVNRIFKDKSGAPVKIDIAEKMRGGSTGPNDKSTKTSLIGAAMEGLGMATKAFAAFVHVLTLGMTSFDSETVISKPSATITMDKDSRKLVFFPTLKLDFIRALKKAAGATVNDILMAGTAGAIRRYSDTRGVTTPQKVRALLPVAFPRSRAELDDPSTSMKNKWAFVSAHLPTGRDTAVDRLTETAREMQAVKESGRVLVQQWVQETILPYLPKFLAQQTAYDIFSRHSMVFSNVPGPQQEMYFANQRMCGLHVLFPNLVNQTMIISYGGGIFMNMVLDPALVPDTQPIVDAFKAEIRDLATKFKVPCEDEDMFMLPSKESATIGMV